MNATSNLDTTSASPRTLPPTPLLDDLSRPFWDGIAAGELRVQRCVACRRWFYPPEPFCPSCRSTELEFQPVAGTGTVYSYSVMRDQRVAGYEDRVPYVNVWVELDEQAGLLMVSLLDAEPDEVEIGQRVAVQFEQISADLTLPTFVIER